MTQQINSYRINARKIVSVRRFVKAWNDVPRLSVLDSSHRTGFEIQKVVMQYEPLSSTSINHNRCVLFVSTIVAVYTY